MHRTILVSLIGAAILCEPMAPAEELNRHYPTNRPPLRPTKFVALPLGSVKPQGWLKDQLTIQANGLTGHLDEFWPPLVTTAWKGGDGESWERGPYYLDGLVPLAYLLDDPRLIAKAKPWIEAILASGQPDGWFGPKKNKDRWPLAVALKVLTQYHEATGDPRALGVIRNYFAYLRKASPDWPNKDWRGVRAMENAVTAYWLYRRTGDRQVLEVVESIQKNSRDWISYFTDFPWTSEALKAGKIPYDWKDVGMTAHVVNVAMATKYPGLWYQQSGDERHKEAVYKGWASLDEHHGQVGGRFSGDEHLSGRRPTQGTELCAVVESMFSLENLVEVLGDTAFADRLEMLAYNANPGACTPDYWAHQYDQQANQVLSTVAKLRWSTNSDTSNLYGLEPHYGCCTANMHQGWPKFVSRLWMATHDQGLAAVAYGPSVVRAKVSNGSDVTVEEITDYPFAETIRFKVTAPEPVEFPLHLRVPGWAQGASVKNGEEVVPAKPGQFLAVRRRWTPGDEIVLTLPMKVRDETRYNGAAAILRGPLVYSLKIGERFEQLKQHHPTLPVIDWAVHPTTPWNYGLRLDRQNPEKSIQVVRAGRPGKQPFAQETAPVVLRVKGRAIPDWKLEANSAGQTPASPVDSREPLVDLEMVPYGCTRLRISEFPVLAESLAFDVKLDVVKQELHPDFCWFHPRVVAIPAAGRQGRPAIVMTLQKHLAASDHYSGLWTMRTDDLGKIWAGPTEVPELAWVTEPNGVVTAVADVTPGWHPQAGKLIAMGCTVRYGKKGEQLSDVRRFSQTAYAVHDPKTGRWSKWQVLELPGDDKFNMARNACAQWLVLPDGTLQVPIYFAKAPNTPASVTVLHCAFDGQKLTYLKHGDELSLNVVRGLCEPSIVAFQGRFYLTIRNDVKGYVTVSNDGLHYEPIRPWTFDDGSELGSYNTQQHWLAHHEGLFLAYTRRGANNDHIPRNRAPIFLAQVDPERLCVIRKSERAIVPERGAMLGNFGAATIDADESWVTDAEYMTKGQASPRGANGSVFAARVLWSKPNDLAPRKAK